MVYKNNNFHMLSWYSLVTLLFKVFGFVSFAFVVWKYTYIEIKHEKKTKTARKKFSTTLKWAKHGSPHSSETEK